MSTNLVDYFFVFILWLAWFTGGCGFVGLVWFIGWDNQASFSLPSLQNIPKNKYYYTNNTEAKKPFQCSILKLFL
jgi:hypothetical protein